MTTSTPPALPLVEAGEWDRMLYAFLAEKERRSGSRRTVTTYARLLRDAFGRACKTPDELTPADAWAWAYGIGLSGREPSSTTVGARLAALSSFYRFLARLQLVDRNPVEGLERPKASPAIPRGLDAGELRRLLAAIDTTTPTGARLRAVVLTLTLTGRRRSEVLELRAGDVQVEGEVAFYSYRGKGGKTGRRELPEPALAAIEAMLAAEGRSSLAELPKAALVFETSQHAVYLAFRRALRRAGLPQSGLHVLRHAAAKLRRDVGESVEDVSRFLDHSSLAVTTTYLRRLEGERDGAWRRVAALLS